MSVSHKEHDRARENEEEMEMNNELQELMKLGEGMRL